MNSKVRECREEIGQTQGELASALGVSRQTINSIEAGRYLPSLPLAIALAHHFNRTVEAIFVVEETKEKK